MLQTKVCKSWQEKIKLKSHTTHFLTCERQQGGERGGLHSILVPGTMSQSIGKQIILKMIGNFSTKSTKTLLRKRNMASYVTYLSMIMSVMYNMPGTGTTLRLPVAWGSFWNKNNSVSADFLSTLVSWRYTVIVITF